MAKKAGGSSRKLGRNKTAALKYRQSGRRERNKLERLATALGKLKKYQNESRSVRLQRARQMIEGSESV